MKFVRIALFCATGACLGVGPALAETMTVELHVSWKEANNRDADWILGESLTGFGAFDETGYFSSRATRNYESAETAWEMSVRRGANREFVSTAMTVMNTMATPQVFSFTMAVPASMAIAAPTQVITSMSLGVGDENADGATLANDLATPIYTARLNSGVLDTLGDPLTLTAGAEQTNSVTENNALGGGPAVAMGDMLGIDMQFELSPGDTATFISTLAITPEPTALALLLAGTAMTLIRRRPRRRTA